MWRRSSRKGRVVAWLGPLCAACLGIIGACSASDDGAADDDGSGGTAGQPDGGREAGAGSGGGPVDSGAGGDGSARDAGNDSGDDPDAADAQRCVPLIQQHESQGGDHTVPDGGNAGFVYNSNPPSSGLHCPVWGSYSIFTPRKPLPSCNYVHNLEHGAIVLLYNCPEGCPDIVQGLELLRADAEDPDQCEFPRVIITPDPKLNTRVAAAAWTRTWKADCLDAAAMSSLAGFISANIGSRGAGTESRACTQGTVLP